MNRFIELMQFTPMDFGNELPDEGVDDEDNFNFE